MIRGHFDKQLSDAICQWRCSNALQVLTQSQLLGNLYCGHRYEEYRRHKQLITAGEDVIAGRVQALKAQAVALAAAQKRARAEKLGDNALAAFVIIQAMLKRSRRLHDFCNRPDLNTRLPNYTVSSLLQPLPLVHVTQASKQASKHVSRFHMMHFGNIVSGKQVRLGFGLHVGWAIEGAIGSSFKIDASYLSPNVNMASRLEAATKQFGVTMLLSDDFVSLLSSSVRSRVRQVHPMHCQLGAHESTMSIHASLIH